MQYFLFWLVETVQYLEGYHETTLIIGYKLIMGLRFLYLLGFDGHAQHRPLVMEECELRNDEHPFKRM